jgi:hypothetical protein
LRDKKLLYGVKQFNLDPKKGMKVRFFFVNAFISGK